MLFKKELIEIVNEPRNEVYSKLLSFLELYCKSFSLILDNEFPYDNSAHEILIRLKKYLISEKETKEWPGTKIISDGFVNLKMYKYNKETKTILNQAICLYDWAHPNMPEDLAFYNDKGINLFGSVAHDKFSFFNAELITKKKLQAVLPELKLKYIKDKLKN